ncbi:hypothetical protein DER44DRAFT_857181 [Fusarium oxysporum]|nr:hypothetical protein DER44DRAFT_857181 [Fusarium oxysporum]
MDPFSKLPSLIQTEIFVHLQSDVSIKQVIQASPYMLWHFITYKKGVLRCILNDILPIGTSGDILRDALKTIDISDRASVKRYEETEIWQITKLPDNSNVEQLQTLWRLFIRIIPFIEDYTSNATRVYPPRAYIGIPDVMDISGSYFKGRRLETNVVRFTSLTSAERHRFFSALTMYELLCKIYYPQWKIIEEQLVTQRQLLVMCKKSDWRVLLSVHGYYKGVYGALFAHCVNSWLPDIPQLSKTGQSPLNSVASSDTNIPSSSRYGLLFPDNTYLNAREYEKAMDTNGRS